MSALGQQQTKRPAWTLSALPPKADMDRRDGNVRFVPIVLQKSPSRLCEIEICNNRIGASVLLNRCCSFVSDLESMFRDQMPKILLQHNPPVGDTTPYARRSK